MLKNVLTHRRFWLVLDAVAAGYLLMLMLTTTPQSIGPGGVVSWFAAAYFWMVASLISLHSYVLNRREIQIGWQTISRQALWAVGGIGVVALRSLGQLQLRDTLLIGLLIAILALYIRRAA